MATTFPVLSVVFRLITPFPPRAWSRYASMCERLPMPASDTTRSEASLARDDHHPDYAVSLTQTYATHTLGRPAHAAGIRLIEADGQPVARWPGSPRCCRR